MSHWMQASEREREKEGDGKLYSREEEHNRQWTINYAM